MALINEKEIFDMLSRANYSILESLKDKIDKDTDLEELREHALELHSYTSNLMKTIFGAIQESEERKERRKNKEEEKKLV